jgi:hypothetical protein
MSLGVVAAGMVQEEEVAMVRVCCGRYCKSID